ncbi:hypothetical protein EJV47_24960 [Hymenobacter gummosus]|uniref:Uncharacterized protein n=1 Tax=Hymenobacter gummosus TaxID=1776032 RepID=A0A3S0K170_9BACT|nr:hypothetical protein [Hymenobacter gummosus]RTQ45394.1 hypothetical protein EJV47_24960 [Hymenobacter gummosus]
MSPPTFPRRRCWYAAALPLLILLLGACQYTPGALPGPAVVVLSDSLPGPVPAPVALRPDTVRPHEPALYLYLQPGADTVRVPWLRRLTRLPTGGWQVDFDRAGRLAGRPLRYVEARRVAISPGRRPGRWTAQLLALTYPQLPPDLGAQGLNERLREEYYTKHQAALYLWFEPQPAYDALPLPARRRLTDTVLLYRRRPVRLGLLRPPGYRRFLLTVHHELQTCPEARSSYDTDFYDGPGGQYRLSEAELFRPALQRLLARAVLQLVQDTRRRRHLPRLLPAQRAEFRRRFDMYQGMSFTPQGLRLVYEAPLQPVSDPAQDPLGALLPADCRPLVLLLPYRILTPYLRPES